MSYDEQSVVADLNRIAPVLRVAFAAACAERLFPAYVTFHDQTGQGNPKVLRASLDRLWETLSHDGLGSAEREAEINSCMKQIPQEEQEGWASAHAYAEDAAAAVAYAWRASAEGDSQEAAWAARRAYESLDHFVINMAGVDVDKALRHPLVQAELQRQKRDLTKLAAVESRESTQACVALLRQRAIAEARTFFLGATERD